MTHARSTLVDTATTPYYHVISRCVRRAFLCGLDEWSGKNYDHRKDWIMERLQVTAETFAIRHLAYAALSNHLHLVVQIDAEASKSWSDREVITRWGRLYPGGLAATFAADAPLLPAQRDYVLGCVPLWRERLASLSWYMRALNEYIARKANREDKCTGRFWQGRFKSQALLDEAALITCMAYVDLNPIRAKLADTPERSDYTSIQQRILAKHEQVTGRRLPGTFQVPLLRFADEGTPSEHTLTIPMYRNDYLELVDWTGRVIRDDKKGAVTYRMY